LFISYIQRGGTLASLYGYKPEIIDVVIAVIIYFSAFAMLMNATIGKLIKKHTKKAAEDIPDEDKAIVADKKEEA
jgi:simple sugar transport system permease protein